MHIYQKLNLKQNKINKQAEQTDSSKQKNVLVVARLEGDLWDAQKM